jgi:exodeoxyribonuclease VII large subunit
VVELARTALGARRAWLDEVEARLRRQDLRLRLAGNQRRLEAAAAGMEQALGRQLARARQRLEPQQAHLAQLSPLKVLERGYAIVEREDGQVVKSPDDAPAGAELRLRLARGEVRARAI